MSNILKGFFILIIGLFCYINFAIVFADTVVVRHVIVTPEPQVKETIVIPTGSASCFTIAAGWANDVWVPEHKVCSYEGNTSGIAWVDSYWRCTKYADDGTCSNWDWVPGHWVKTMSVY